MCGRTQKSNVGGVEIIPFSVAIAGETRWRFRKTIAFVRYMHHANCAVVLRILAPDAEREATAANNSTCNAEKDVLAAKLFKWHDAAWLQARRIDFDIGGSQRPGTRLHSGHVGLRWDEALEKAKELLRVVNARMNE